MIDHQISRNVPEGIRRSLADAIASYYSELSLVDREVGGISERFSLRRFFAALRSGDGVRDGFERELCSANAKMLGLAYDPMKPMLPWQALDKRDLTVASAGGGGYLVGTKVRPAVDILRGFSVAADAGITGLEGLVGNVAIPKVITSATAGAIANEATTTTESTPVLGQAVLTPKTLGSYVEFTRLMDLQVPDLEQFLASHLLRVAGELLDKNILYGSGASGELLGLTSTTGVTSQSGTSLSWAGIRAMRKACILAGARETDLAWIGAADTQETLSGRERFTGGGRALWDDNGIGSRPAYPTKVAAAGSLFVGPWSSAVLGLWGGMTLEVNPFQGFTTGLRSARLFISADLAVTNSAAFSISTSVT